MASLEEFLEDLWNESPLVQRERSRAWAEGYAEGLAKARAEGYAKGSLEISRSFVETVVNVRFPALSSLAHQKVAAMTQPEVLRTLLVQIVVAPNEQTVRALLLPQQPS